MKKNQSFLLKFLKLESSSGILLMIATVLALITANSPLKSYYSLLLQTPVVVKIGGFGIEKPLLLWINDGLMAIFFLLVGLELKREMIEGEFSDKKNIVLPGLGAIGGMAIPALIYVFFNKGDSTAMAGWAIPAATDIAFALGILSLLGSRVPTSVKIFLTSLAIFDDIGAILIIAIFYTEKISFTALLVVALCIAVLLILNKKGIDSKSPYFTVGIIMWAAMLKSGVHATLAGVILALFIPLKSRNGDFSPLKQLESDLHNSVAFFILPVFAFANAGINFEGMGLTQLFHPVTLGITLGLFLGKQIGIFSFCLAAVKMKIAKLPDSMSLSTLYGTSILCGVGFTMSLFIGSLAFEDNATLVFDERLGIMLGSLLSGLIGYFVLSFTLKKAKTS